MQHIITKTECSNTSKMIYQDIFLDNMLYLVHLLGKKQNKTVNIRYLPWKLHTRSNPLNSRKWNAIYLLEHHSIPHAWIDCIQFWSLMGFMNSFLSLMSVATYLNETFEKTTGLKVCFSASDCCAHWKWILMGCFKKTRSCNTCNCLVAVLMV